MDNTPDLWHRRLNHCFEQVLRQLRLIPPKAHLSTCEVCQRCKPTFNKLQTIELYKYRPQQPLQLWLFDLLMPSKECKGAHIIAIDAYSRYAHCQYIRDTGADSTLHDLQSLLAYAKTPPKILQFDRQSSFTATITQNWLKEHNFGLKFVTPARHGELNSLVERQIQSLRLMARTSMLDARLSTSFWPHATNYATYVKNRLPHTSLNGKAPIEVHLNQSPRLQTIKRFGSVCYQLKPLTQCKDKFLPITTPKVFSVTIKKASMKRR